MSKQMSKQIPKPVVGQISQCLSLFDLDVAAITKVLNLAHAMKANPNEFKHSLQGKSIALLFEKPSLRTRVSFDVGIHQLGGHAVYLDSKQVGPGARETISDIAHNLACWTQAIVARVYNHQTLVDLNNAKVPVVNALCDQHHPCQTLADLMTIQELFSDHWEQVHIAYVGDGNNVAQSLMIGAAALGLRMTVVTPVEHAPSSTLIEQLSARYPDHRVQLSDKVDALHEVDIIYTDTWISMGEDVAQSAAKKARLQPYQVNHRLVESSGAQHVMHCLPAHRDEEITSELLDQQLHVVLRQAENRMHAQKALLALMLNEEHP